MKNIPAHRRNTVATTGLSLLVAGSLSLTVLLFVAPASASKSTKSATTAAENYGVINATVDAATDHEILGSSAFPNYTNGAVDNYYSWAHSHVDNSPFAEGTASPVDTGPLGQTAAAGNFSQPQYADARWPGNSGKATFGNQGGPYGVSAATPFNAVANSEEASASGSGASGSSKSVAAPKGFNSRLRLALAAWKAKWLPRLGIKTPKPPTITTPIVTTPVVTLPLASKSSTTKTSTTSTSTTKTSTTPTSTTSTTPSSSPDNSLLASSSLAAVDPGSGAVVTSGESSLAAVNIGGQIVIKKIDVSAEITNGGKPTDKVSVDIGAASVGGVPVTIDQNGVAVQGQGQALPYQQADDALNTALKQAGVELFTVLPEVAKATNQETITATGVHVKFTQPVDQSGVPAQYLEHILGEVYVDSLAAPAGPVPKLKLGKLIGTPVSGTSSSSTGGVGGGSTGFSSGGGGTSSSYSSTPTSGSTGSTAVSQNSPASFTSVLHKPMWLLAAFLVWQVLAIGTGASLWRWRAAGAT